MLSMLNGYLCAQKTDQQASARRMRFTGFDEQTAFFLSSMESPIQFYKQYNMGGCMNSLPIVLADFAGIMKYAQNNLKLESTSVS
jgi:hypothetical protein